MQIRVRGKKVEYLRAHYDPEKGRSIQRLIKPDEFTFEEREQAAEYAQKIREGDRIEKQREAAKYASDHLRILTAGIKGGTRPMSQALLWEAMKELHLALREAKIIKPAPKPKEPKKPAKKAVKRKITKAVKPPENLQLPLNPESAAQ